VSSFFIVDVLRQFSDDCGLLSWDDNLNFYVNCNDLFMWACADLEPVKDDKDLELLAKCKDDCWDYFNLLYCCRKRGYRPQKPYYEYICEEYHHLFDQCGPEVGHE